MKATVAVILFTIFLIGYSVVYHTGVPVEYLTLLFILSPFTLIWLVYTVLIDNRHKYPELKDDEEWGYLDFTRKNE